MNMRQSAAVLPLLLGLLLVLAGMVHASRAAGVATAVCDAEGECRPLAVAAAEPHDHDLQRAEGGGDLKDAVEALVAWVTAQGDRDDEDKDRQALLERWTAPEVVVEAEGTPNVPWRGRFVGRRSAATFLRRLRRGLSSASGTAAATTTDGATSGLRWSTSASGTGIGTVVQWEPPSSPECDAWLMAWSDGDSSDGGDGRLARLSLHHSRSVECAAAHRTRAQRAFDGAFAHFFRKDYAAFRTSFAPDLVLTWHGDAPVGKVFHGNGEEGLMAFIRTRVQIFIQTSVEFEPIVADESSASYYVVFRPLTIRATEQSFGEVRGLLVIRINDAGLIDQYQMVVLDHRVSAALARSVHDD